VNVHNVSTSASLKFLVDGRLFSLFRKLEFEVVLNVGKYVGSILIPPKDATGEILFGDVGILTPSLMIHLSNLVQQKRIQQLPEARWVLTKNNICLKGP
jgi:hypothetical protein